MPAAARRIPTFEELYAEIEALPEGMTGEILGPGELRVMSRPGGRHRASSRRIAHALGGSDLLFGGHGWWIEVEVEIELPDGRLYVPDLAGWRCHAPPDFVDDTPITVLPDRACEILSRRTQAADRTRKLPHYAQAGVGHVWVVDPDARTVEVYETQNGKPVLVATALDQVTLELPPFPHPLDVGSFWKPARPNPTSSD